MSNNIGARIRQLREDRSLGIPELAERAQMSNDDVIGLENGQRQVHHEEIQRIATALDVPIDSLFAEAEEESGGSSVLIPTAQLNKLLAEMKDS